MTIAAVVLAWAPVAIFCALQGFDPLHSFLVDLAAQSRLLLVIPLLILGEPLTARLLEDVARHFPQEGMIADPDRERFEAELLSFQRGSRSIVSQVVIFIIAFGIPVSLTEYIRSGVFLPWCYIEGGTGPMSPAGLWYSFVSFPLMSFLLLRWIWLQVKWTWFLHTVSRMDLRLIAVHPDLVGGLGFVEVSLWGYLPFSLAVGTVAAGGVANRTIHLSRPLADFQYAPLAVAAVVLILCVGPLTVFGGTLLRTMRRGIFEYGSLATKVGRQLERKWLRPEDPVDKGSLEVQDFSATTDLYQIVGNVFQLRVIPVGMKSVIRLLFFSLIPAIVVILVSLPFKTILQELARLLF